MDLHARAISLETQEGTAADEAVAAQTFAADDALEQKRPVAFLNLAEGADRRQRVADELAIDRHQAHRPGGRAGQGNEFLEAGTMAHARGSHSGTKEKTNAEGVSITEKPFPV